MTISCVDWLIRSGCVVLFLNACSKELGGTMDFIIRKLLTPWALANTSE